MRGILTRLWALDGHFHPGLALQVLSENAELSSRLIDVALTSDNDIFEAAFGGDDGSNGNGMATMPLGHWSQEATQKRRQEAQEEVCVHMKHTMHYRNGYPAPTSKVVGSLQ